MTLPRLSAIIPTYGREQPLIDTLECYRRLGYPRDLIEAIVVDQTRSHDVPTTHYLESMHASGEIRWYRHPDVNFALRRCT